MLKINQLYIENFKLFSRKLISFNSSCLSILDGPNGYGKTSVFDAVELLVTGVIKRVFECQAINGSDKYDTVFLAKNINENVVLKAEFVDDETGNRIIIGSKILSATLKGRYANPKQIFNHIQFYLLPSFSISNDSWDDYLRTPAEIDKIRRDIFGKQTIEQYSLFHYIQQEDRLSYFAQTETNRSASMDSLLEIDDFFERLNNIESKCKAIKKLHANLTKIYEEKNERLQSNNSVNFDVEYTRLLGGEIPWDQEIIYFPSSNQETLYRQYNEEVSHVEKYYLYRQDHERFFSYKAFCDIPEEKRADVLFASVLSHRDPDFIERARENNDELIFLRRQKEQLDLKKYLDVDFLKLHQYLNLNLSSISTEVEKLKIDVQNHNKLQIALNNIIRMREQFYDTYSKISDDGICPCCGYNWLKKEELDDHFAITKEVIIQRLGTDQEQYELHLTEIEERVDEIITETLVKRIEYLENMDSVKVIRKFDAPIQLVNYLEKAKGIFSLSIQNVSLAAKQESESDALIRDRVMEYIDTIGSSFSKEYLLENESVNFQALSEKYHLTGEVVQSLSTKNIENKRKYIASQYYKSFDQTKKEVDTLGGQLEKIEEIKNQLDTYKSVLENSIAAYRKQIIDSAEILFYIYSSRLLQSYQGGQGVMISIKDGEKMRFVTPGREHDALYTMSSGQLSAVILAFSLALFKIYSGDQFRVLLIDDPIQCMDDINMISFVELLKNDFSDSQVIMSTHEEAFSSYLRYKYRKAGKESISINLQKEQTEC